MLIPLFYLALFIIKVSPLFLPFISQPFCLIVHNNTVRILSIELLIYSFLRAFVVFLFAPESEASILWINSVSSFSAFLSVCWLQLKAD